MIDLTGLHIATATPRLVEFGGLLTPALGGPVQRVDRLGTRWAMTFQTPPMRLEPAGREWASRIARAKLEGASITVPQPGLLIDFPGAPVVAAGVISGRQVQIGGLPAGYPIRRGQWITLVHDARRYLDQVVNDVVAANNGTATVTLQNLLRSPMTAGDQVLIAAPKIEGWIQDATEWPIQTNRTTAFTFTIAEAA